MNKVINSLLKPAKLWSRDDVLLNPSPVPPNSGIYAWYFETMPPKVPITRSHFWQGMALLYVGNSPSRENSARNLNYRIREHYRGNAYGSTLRKSLGCLLSENLGIYLQQVGDSGKRIHFGEGESILSEWMMENAYVTWMIVEKPWDIEDELICQLNLPLNLKGNKHHPFHPILSSVRKKCMQLALR